MVGADGPIRTVGENEYEILYSGVGSSVISRRSALRSGTKVSPSTADRGTPPRLLAAGSSMHGVF
jgi:hypothetical protein